jgi:FkbM family methyltransferase
MEPIQVRENNSLMYLDNSDVSKIIRDNGYFELETTTLIKALLKKDDIALDIGAHIGYYTLLMARKCKEVLAFEPNQINYSNLRENIKLNKLNNVITINAAVTEKEGFTQLCKHWENTGMHRIYCANWCRKDHEYVTTKNIDSIIEKADFIKMDCEGSELGALKGMKKLLENNNVTLIMEFHPPSIREYGAEPRDIFNFMRDLGYSFALVGYQNTRYPLSYIEIEPKASDPIGGYNLICKK